MKLRPAVAADLAVIMHHRRSMFREMGYRNEAELDAMVALHASEAGRPLYERLGFTPTNEMRLKLK